MLALKLCFLLLFANHVFSITFSDESYFDESYTSRFTIYGRTTSTKRPKTKSTTTVTEATTRSYPITTEETTPSEKPTTTSEESTTTSEEPTTTSEEPTTTLLPPTTTEEPSCNYSLFTKSDLQSIVNRVIKDRQPFGNVEKYVSEMASNMRDNYMQELDDIYTWLENRPKHLFDVLKGFNVKRKKLEPLIDQIVNSFDKFQTLSQDFQDKNVTASELFVKFERNNKICDLNCGKHILILTNYMLRRRPSYDPTTLYCGTLDETENKVAASFSNYSKKLEEAFKIRASNDNKAYGEEVDELMDILRNYTISKFQNTLLQVLGLQDDYYHFTENITSLNFEDSLLNIKLNVADLYPKLVLLGNDIERFGKYCRTCDQKQAFRSLSYVDGDGAETFNLLEEVIGENKKNYDNSLINMYEDILKPLNDRLEQPYEPDFEENLDNTQQAVAIETAKHRAELDNLLNRVDDLPLSQVGQVLQESTALLNKVEHHISLINDFIKH